MAPARSRALRLLGTPVSRAALSVPSRGVDTAPGREQQPEGWLEKSYGRIAGPAAPKSLRDERAALARIVAKRTADDIARHLWWSAVGPVQLWNELMLQEMQDSVVVLPWAARHLCLLHVVVEVAVAYGRS